MGSGVTLFVGCLGAVLLTYVLIQFVFLPDNTFLSFPVHHDDYANLSHTSNDLRLRPIRPVSSFVLAVLSMMGIDVFYTALHVMTVLYITLVLALLLDLFDMRKPNFVLLVGMAIPIMSFESLVEYTKYTGMITSLVSGVLGVCAMALLLRAFTVPDALRLKLVAGLVLSVLSLLAKEDFILAILLMCGWFGLVGPLLLRRQCRTASVAAIVLALATIAFFLHNRFVVQSPFTGSTGGTYSAIYTPASLAKTAWNYLTITILASIVSAIQCGAVVLVALLNRRANWRSLLLVQALVAALVIPYACLPNHVFPFYALNWIPWQIGGAVLALVPVFAPLAPRSKVVVLVALLVLGALVAYVTYPRRYSVMKWYVRNAETNWNMVQTVWANRDALQDQAVVGVTGVPLLCPWLLSDGSFLANRWGSDHRWLVFVPRDSDFYKVMLDRTALTLGRVETHDEQEIKSFLGIPVLSFKADGTGKLVWNKPESAEAH